MASELLTWMEAVAARVRLIPIIATNGIEVIPFAPGNLASVLSTKLGSGIGIVVVLGFGKIGRPGNQSLRPQFSPLRFFARVAENAFLNKTRPHALEIAERIDAELMTSPLNAAAPFLPDVPGANLIERDGDMEQLVIAPAPGSNMQEQNLDGWDVPFRSKFAPVPAGN